MRADAEHGWRVAGPSGRVSGVLIFATRGYRIFLIDHKHNNNKWIFHACTRIFCRLCPGVKAATSLPALPLRVNVVAVEPASSSSAIPQLGAAGAAAADGHSSGRTFLDDRLFLVYTGKTRLAKDLLQRVLRQWSLRDNGVTTLVSGLRANAVRMAGAIERGDAVAVGSYLDTYFAQKKQMAPGSEPAPVTEMLNVLRGAGAILGASLAGAGGGGFLVCVAAEPGGNTVSAVERVLRAHPATASAIEAGGDISVHAVSVDRRGLVVTVQQ